MLLLVEEASWQLDGGPGEPSWEAYASRLEKFFDRLDVARERGEPYQASRELLEQAIGSGKRLHEVLWSELLSRDVRERAAAHFGRMSYWDDERDYVSLDAVIEHEPVFSPSAALAAQLSARGDVVSCVPLPGRWQRRVEVVVEGQSAMVWFVVDEPTHRGWLRHALASAGNDASALRRLAPHAFPDLWFHSEVWDGLRHFEGGYDRVREALHRFLSLLDDEGAWIFSDRSAALLRSESSAGELPVTRRLIQQRFGAHGLDVAPESPDVANDRAQRRARERTIGGRALYCEWHFRIERHINRVHFHEPVPESNGRVVVAIFHSHLP